MTKTLYLLEYWSDGVMHFISFSSTPILPYSGSRLLQILSEAVHSTDFNAIGQGSWTGLCIDKCSVFLEGLDLVGKDLELFIFPGIHTQARLQTEMC